MRSVGMQPKPIAANPDAYPRLEGQEAGALSAFAALVQSDSPVGWWRLGEQSGTVAVDLGSQRNNGTYTGGYTLNRVPLVNGDTNPSATFDGTTGYVEIADNAAYSIPTTNKITIVAIVQAPATAPSGIQNIVAKGASGQYEWALRWNGIGIECVAWDLSGGTVTAAGGSNVWSAAQWASDFAGRTMFIAVTFDNTIAGANPMLVYVNKTSSPSGAKAAVPADGTGPLEIGRRGDNTGYLSSTLVQDVLVFPVVLSAARLSQYVDAVFGQPSTTDTEALTSSETATALPSLALTDTEALGTSELAAQSVVYPSWSGVTDAFDTPSNWYISAGASISGGRGSMTPGTTGAGGESLQSVALHDLTGAYVSVQYIQVLNQVAGAQTSLEMRPQGLGTNTFLLLLENGTLALDANIGGSYTTVASIAWDAPNMQYWRIRESNGSLIGEVSPDASTWTQVGSWRYLGSPITVTDMQVNLGASTWTAVASPGTAIVDNLNIALANITPSDTEALGSSESSSIASTSSATDAEALASGESASPLATIPTTDTETLGSTQTAALLNTTTAPDTEALTSSEAATSLRTSTATDTEALVSAESSPILAATALADTEALGSSEVAAITVGVVSTDTEALGSVETASIAFVAIVSTDSETLVSGEASVILTTRTTADAEALGSAESATAIGPLAILGSDTETLVSSDAASTSATVPVTDAEALGSTDSGTAILTGLNVSAADSEALVSSETPSTSTTRTAADTETLGSGETQALTSTNAAADSEALGSSDAASVGNPITATDSSAAVSTDALTVLYAPTYAESTVAASSDVYALQMQAVTVDSDALGTAEIVSVGSPVTAVDSDALGSIETISTTAALPQARSDVVVSAESSAVTFESLGAADAETLGSIESSAESVSTAATDAELLGTSEQSSVGSPIGSVDASAVGSAEIDSLGVTLAFNDTDTLGSSEQLVAQITTLAAETTLLVTTDDFALFRLTPVDVADADQLVSTEVLDESVLAAISETTPITALEVITIFSTIQLDDASVIVSTDVLLALLSVLLLGDTAPIASDEQSSVVEYAGKGYPDLSQGSTRADVARIGRRTAPFTYGASRASTTVLVR
jgi:hypothetical protein